MKLFSRSCLSVNSMTSKDYSNKLWRKLNQDEVLLVKYLFRVTPDCNLIFLLKHRYVSESKVGNEYSTVCLNGLEGMEVECTLRYKGKEKRSEQYTNQLTLC